MEPNLDELLNKRDIKRAEVLIARSLRAELSVRERARLLIARARARLLSARVDDALEDLDHARDLLLDEFETPLTIELLADCHFARFELASVGFADRSDTAQALAAYERILADFPEYSNRGWIYYQRGRILLTENRTEDAVDCFQNALLTPSIVTTLTAYCYERLGFVAFYEHRDFDHALSFLSKAVSTYSTGDDRLWLVHVHTLRSRVFRETRNYDSAIDAANTAINVAQNGEGKAGLADALLNAAETLMALPCSRAWLDLQRFVVDACVALGDDYNAIAIAIRSELRTLLRDLPNLLEVTLSDDTPAANAQTQAWLRELMAEPGGAAPLPSGGTAVPLHPEAPGWQKKFIDPHALALEAVRTGHAQKGVEILQKEVERQLSGRGRFQRKLQLAQICAAAGKDPIVQLLCDDLAAAIDAHKLEEWEDRGMIASVMVFLLQTSKKIQGDAKVKQAMFERLCRLDPVQALAI